MWAEGLKKSASEFPHRPPSQLNGAQKNDQLHMQFR